MRKKESRLSSLGMVDRDHHMSALKRVKSRGNLKSRPHSVQIITKEGKLYAAMRLSVVYVIKVTV